MKNLILLAVILWQGNVPELSFDKGRVVLTDDGEAHAERLITHIDCMGQGTEFWQKSDSMSSSIFKAAILESTHKIKPMPAKMLNELDRMLK